MSEGTPAPAPPQRRRAIPLATSVIITLLAVASAVEGVVIYWMHWQVMASSQVSDQVRDLITKRERELQQVNNTLQQYGELVSYADVGRLKEQVKDANPPTLEGYLSGLEGKLKTTLSKLDEMQSGWSAMEKARDDAIKAQVTAETEVKKKAEEFRQTADLLAKQLQAEKEARQKDVADLEVKVAKAQEELKKSEEVSNEAGRKHNALLAALGDGQKRVDRLRLLLAQALHVAPPAGLGPALLVTDRLELSVAAAESLQNISYVRFPIPADRKLEVGMRFLILDSQRRPKCLVQLANVLEDKALAQVVEKYSTEPVAAGDPAELDLAYEEVRTPAATTK
jgi:hypothetical protein